MGTREEKIYVICRYSGTHQSDILKNILSPVGLREQSRWRLVSCWASFRLQPFNTWSSSDLVNVASQQR